MDLLGKSRGQSPRQVTGAADDWGDDSMAKRKRTPSNQEAPRTDKPAPRPPTFVPPRWVHILAILSATVSLNVQDVLDNIGEGELTHARTHAPCTHAPHAPHARKHARTRLPTHPSTHAHPLCLCAEPIVRMANSLSDHACADHRHGMGFTRQQNIGGDVTLPQEYEAMTLFQQHAPTAFYRLRLSLAVFLALCHSDTPWGRAFDRLRQRCRAATRRRAMGVSGCTVDLDLGLRVLLSAIGFPSMLEELRQAMPAEERQLWGAAQIVRALFRWGLMRRWWVSGVERWPMCFFGMVRCHWQRAIPRHLYILQPLTISQLYNHLPTLQPLIPSLTQETAALYYTGQYLTGTQRRSMRRAFDTGCAQTVQWMGSIQDGCATQGTITIFDSHGQYVVAYTHIVPRREVLRVCAQGGGRDLHSLLTSIARGEAQGSTEAGGPLEPIPPAASVDAGERWSASLGNTLQMHDQLLATGHCLARGARGFSIACGGPCVDRVDAVSSIFHFADPLPDAVRPPEDACERCGASVQCGSRRRFCAECRAVARQDREQVVAAAGDAAEASASAQIAARGVTTPAVSSGVLWLARQTAAHLAQRG